MWDAVIALVKEDRRRNGDDDWGGMAGEDLARAMPRALTVNIRATLNALEEENILMVDGPQEGLDGVRVYEIDGSRETPGPQDTEGEHTRGHGVRDRFWKALKGAT